MWQYLADVTITELTFWATIYVTFLPAITAATAALDDHKLHISLLADRVMADEEIGADLEQRRSFSTGFTP